MYAQTVQEDLSTTTKNVTNAKRMNISMMENVTNVLLISLSITTIDAISALFTNMKIVANAKNVIRTGTMSRANAHPVNRVNTLSLLETVQYVL